MGFIVRSFSQLRLGACWECKFLDPTLGRNPRVCAQQSEC